MYKEFGEKVRRLRKEMGYSQERLARNAGLDRQMVRKIEGGYMGSADAYIKLSDYLNLSLDTLRGGKAEADLIVEVTDIIERLIRVRDRLEEDESNS